MTESEIPYWRMNVLGFGWAEARDESAAGTSFVLDARASRTGRVVFVHVAGNCKAVTVYDGIVDREHLAVAYGEGMFPRDGVLVKSSWAKCLAHDFDRLPEEVRVTDLQTMLDGENPLDSSLTRWMESMIENKTDSDIPFLDC